MAAALQHGTQSRDLRHLISYLYRHLGRLSGQSLNVTAGEEDEESIAVFCMELNSAISAYGGAVVPCRCRSPMPPPSPASLSRLSLCAHSREESRVSAGRGCGGLPLGSVCRARERLGAVARPLSADPWTCVLPSAVEYTASEVAALRLCQARRPFEGAARMDLDAVCRGPAYELVWSEEASQPASVAFL